MLNAYVLIETEIGTSPKVAERLRAINEVLSVSRVTGPHDVIAMVKALDINALGGLLQDVVGSVPGVLRTVTCVVVSQPK